MTVEEEEVCGEMIDLFEERPGVIVRVCARRPHSGRAWHKTEDGTFAWREPSKRQRSRGVANG